MRVLMVASEAVPYAQTGGLAEVVGALPQALARLGHHVDVVLPGYRGTNGATRIATVPVQLGRVSADAEMRAVAADGVRTIFVDRPEYFDRDFLYGAVGHDYHDNPERFAFLTQAALAWVFASGEQYDVVHGHDWQVGLLPVQLSHMFRLGTARQRIPCVFTIHNLAYQGIFDASWLPRLGLPWELMHVDAIEYWNRISYLKAGINFSRMITTVSPRYGEEIQTPELGFGFDGILRARRADLVGILNGIDYDQWDPSRDPHLPEPYSASNLAGKRAAKRRLLLAFGLADSSELMKRPLVGMTSRLVDQKGFDLLAELADELPRLDATFVLLGSGERRYEDLWLGLASRYPDRIATRIGFDEPLSHLLEGGADLFLMPSRFEPCGLNQMYSLRYGTVPVVRATGGLYDTVQNFEARTGEGTGFTFDQYSAQALLDTLRWALATFGERDTWRRLQLTGMREDFSWDASAREYVKVYDRAANHGVWG